MATLLNDVRESNILRYVSEWIALYMYPILSESRERRGTAMRRRQNIEPTVSRVKPARRQLQRGPEDMG